MSAAIIELTPDRHPSRGLATTSVTPLGGQAVGAVLASIATTLTTTPGSWIFGAFTVIALVGIAVVALVPETRPRTPGAWRSLLPRVAVPTAARRDFRLALPVLAAAWLTAGFYFGLVPNAIAEVFHRESGALGGSTVAILTGIGAVASLTCRRLDSRDTAALGATALAIGMSLNVASIASGSLALFLTGTAIASVGFGTAFSGVVGLIVSNADDHERSGLYSAVYVASALAYGLPVIVAGIATDHLGMVPTAAGMATATMICATVGAWLHRPSPLARVAVGRRPVDVPRVGRDLDLTFSTAAPSNG